MPEAREGLDVTSNAIPFATPEAYASDLLGVLIAWGLDRAKCHAIALAMAQNCAGISEAEFFNKFSIKGDNAVDAAN